MRILGNLSLCVQKCFFSSVSDGEHSRWRWCVLESLLGKKNMLTVCDGESKDNNAALFLS